MVVLIQPATGRARWLAICGAAVAIGCASSAHAPEPRSEPAGEAAGAAGESNQAEAGGAAGVAGEKEIADGGAPTASGAAGADSAAGAVGATDQDVGKHAPSGQRLCEVDLDCDPGLICSGSTGRVNRACLARCESDADCRHDERCFAQNSIEKSCFRSCQESYTVCSFQFDCMDYYRMNQYLCIPTEWARNWPPASGAGS